MRKVLTGTAVLVCIFMLSSCIKDKLTKTYTIFEPVYRDKATVLGEIKSNPARSIQNPGKIYKYGNFIFLNEVNKGVHVIDNSNPSNPLIKAFISIPGNVDIAVKGNILYADLYTDLVVINISDPLQANLVKLVPSIFPERQYGNGFNPDTTKVIVDWIQKEVTVRISAFDNGGLCTNCSVLQSSGGSGAAASPTIGIGGSMARFALVNDYLYAVNRANLQVLNTNNPANPVHTATRFIGWNIETIYPFKQKLFIGSSTGMFIFNINNPALPVNEGAFTHARACDPVVADDNFAYVTLRAGNFCQGTNNQLDIINVQNLPSVSLVKTYNMTNPFGLAKDGNLLFICDGKDGLKVYDSGNVLNLQLRKHIKGMETFDVIAANSILLLVAKDGLYQYSYSNPDNIHLLSKITVNR